MSKVEITGNASGTGTLTVAAPNTNSDYTLTLPESTGTMATEAYAATLGLIQRNTATYATYAALTTTIPFDDTIPQNTEGTEVLTVSITPTNSSSILRVTANMPMLSAASQLHAMAALFRDSTANAIQVGDVVCDTVTDTASMTLVHEVVAGSTSSTTFKLRIGPNTSTMYVSGQGAARKFGGATHVTLIVEEIEP